MTDLRPDDEVDYLGSRWQVSACNGLDVELRNLHDATHLVVSTASLLSDESFSSANGPTSSLIDLRLLDLMPEGRRRRAEFWFEHLYEVEHGMRPAERGLVDARIPAGTVGARLEAKRDELRSRGVVVSMATMWRRYGRYRRGGTVGCADQRGLPGHVRRSGIDPAVIVVINEVTRSFTDKSTPSRKQVIEIVYRALAEQGVRAPSWSAMYVLLAELDRGRHTFGMASTRRSLSGSPDRAYGTFQQSYPGQEVQLDATPLDAVVLTVDGRTITSVDMVVAIDVATRTIGAAILRPNASKTVDAVELLSKAMVPQPMLPGWDESIAMARSYLSDVLLGQAELAEHVAARPILDIRSVVVDRGKVFVSQQFIRALLARGIDYRIASPGEGTAKPIVERVFLTIGEDFVRWVKGFKGRSVAYRGRDPERDAVWPLPLLQSMLDEWVVAVYQNQVHSGLAHNLMPRLRLSPNDMYRAQSSIAPPQVRTLSRDEWISLLPCAWRVIGRRGVQNSWLFYDNESPRFHDLRRTKSPDRLHNGKWEVRYDPGNVMLIWIRDVERDQWIECHWVRARYSSFPFSLEVLGAILDGFDDKRRVTDLEVWRRAEELHRRLDAGPPPPKSTDRALIAADRGRTRAAMASPIPDADIAAIDENPLDSGVDGATAADSPSVHPMPAMRSADQW